MSFIYNYLWDVYSRWTLPRVYVVSIASINNLPETPYKRYFLYEEPIGISFPGTYGIQFPFESLLVNVHIKMYNNSFYKPLLIKDLHHSDYVGLDQRQYFMYLSLY